MEVTLRKMGMGAILRSRGNSCWAGHTKAPLQGRVSVGALSERLTSLEDDCSAECHHSLLKLFVKFSDSVGFQKCK